MDLFKDCQTQFSLDILLRIPTKGNSKIHSVNFDQVQAWSNWFYGGEAQELSVSKDMKIHAIDPNKTRNQGLVNRHNIRLRMLSGALHFIAKNHLKRASYNSFYPQK
eukprot:11395567-Ditylum_brightwellii.AAC.1